MSKETNQQSIVLLLLSVISIGIIFIGLTWLKMNIEILWVIGIPIILIMNYIKTKQTEVDVFVMIFAPLVFFIYFYGYTYNAIKKSNLKVIFK